MKSNFFLFNIDTARPVMIDVIPKMLSSHPGLLLEKNVKLSLDVIKGVSSHVVCLTLLPFLLPLLWRQLGPKCFRLTLWRKKEDTKVSAEIKMQTEKGTGWVNIQLKHSFAYSPPHIQSGKAGLRTAPSAEAPPCWRTGTTSRGGRWDVHWPRARCLTTVWLWGHTCNSTAWSSPGSGPPLHYHHTWKHTQTRWESLTTHSERRRRIVGAKIVPHIK